MPSRPGRRRRAGGRSRRGPRRRARAAPGCRRAGAGGSRRWPPARSTSPACWAPPSRACRCRSAARARRGLDPRHDRVAVDHVHDRGVRLERRGRVARRRRSSAGATTTTATTVATATTRPAPSTTAITADADGGHRRTSLAGACRAARQPRSGIDGTARPAPDAAERNSVQTVAPARLAAAAFRSGRPPAHTPAVIELLLTGDAATASSPSTTCGPPGAAARRGTGPTRPASSCRSTPACPARRRCPSTCTRHPAATLSRRRDRLPPERGVPLGRRGAG